MDLSVSTWWWVAAGALVALELATGTFYLLMLALGAAGGALAALAGLAVGLQWLAATLLGLGATGLWHRHRGRQRQAPAPSQNPDVNLDIGNPVQVDAWGPDRSARVNYRGTQWQARLAEGAHAAPGPHRISAVEANWLVLSPLPAAATQTL
ncbi:MAG TPA: NfeD family protein [Ideonella sp.]|uniref:NfeD family protein n=1 Tax=Ideonella sp. TaxID=1929293 RepID=UPI002CB5516B|nr:NfeD family protein [Ideonella sp.]HSI49746.1 NfeD family protein [Ideonella sp.]